MDKQDVDWLLIRIMGVWLLVISIFFMFIAVFELENILIQMMLIIIAGFLFIYGMTFIFRDLSSEEQTTSEKKHIYKTAPSDLKKYPSKDYPNPLKRDGGHFIMKCSECMKFLGQCRCPGPKETTWDLCPECKGKLEEKE